MRKDVVVARHLLQVADGVLVVAFHHLADAHLVVGLTRDTTTQVSRIDIIVFQRLVVVLLLEISIGNNLRHLRLAFLVGLADVIGSLLYHRLIIAFEVFDLHDIRRYHFGIVLMLAQETEVVQSHAVAFLDILDVGVIIACRVLVLTIVHHQAVEQRHSLIQLARLKIGITHVELHLLCLIGGQRGGIRLFVNGQRLLVFLFLEQVIGIQEIGMFRPCTAWIVVHKPDDFGWTIGLSEIKRADRLVILRIDTTLRFGIGNSSAVLGEG